MKLIDTKLKLCELGTNPFCIETKDEHIKLHTLFVACGARGSGKSFLVSQMLNWLEFDEIFYISPTMESNHQQFKHLNVNTDYIFDPDDPECIDKVINIGNQIRDELIEYRQKKQILKELKKLYGKPSNMQENFELFSEYVNPVNMKWIEPEHKYNGKRPVMALFVDDAQSTAIFRNRKFLNTCLKHRHLFSMPGDESSLGISIFISIQSYTSTGGGLPRAIRNNLTHLSLFRCKNIKQLKLISEEMAGEVSPDKFMEIYDFIMSDPAVHTSMFVDLHKKPNHPSQFRKNYLEFVVD